jgi:hypothetical protein
MPMPPPSSSRSDELLRATSMATIIATKAAK